MSTQEGKVVGLETVYIAEIENISETGVPTYKKPVKLARGIDVTLTPKVAEATLYAGDVLDESVSSITGYDISLNINQLSNAQKALLLGHDVDANGMISVGPNDTPKEVAVLFSAPLSSGDKEYRVMYRVKFKPSDESFKTKTDNIEFQTPTITGVSVIREDIQKYGASLRDTTAEAKKITAKWFDSVAVPVASPQ